MSTLVTPQQRQQFIEDGFVVVSGLIPEEIVTATRENLCQAMNLSLTDPATWPKEERVLPLETAVLTEPCRTESMDEAAEELVGDFSFRGQCISSVLDRAGKPPYIKGFIPVVAFPRPGEKRYDPEKQHDGFHVDGIHFASLWPGKIVLVVMVYLHDTKDYGGATVVRPGSHRQIFEYWQERGEIPEADAIVPDLKYSTPTAIGGKAGDVIFMHHLMLHSGSANYDDYVRLAINSNFASDPAKNYEVKAGAPQDNWTPLDWTMRTDNLPQSQVACQKTPYKSTLSS